MTQHYDNIIIDSSSLFHFLYHGEKINPENSLVRNINGEKTEVHTLASYVRYCKKLHDLFPNARIIHALDPADDSQLFRKEAYPEYKENREEKNPDLKKQLSMLPKLLGYLNAEAYSHPQFEGDDIIATLTETLEGKTLIYSRDKDLMQLVSEDVHCIRSLKTENGQFKELISTEDQVVEQYGVKPHLIPEYLALVGDSADNIKGVSGIGPKTAKTLLQNDKGLLYWLENPEEFPKQKKFYTDEVANAFMFNLNLTNLKTEVPLEKNPTFKNTKLIQKMLLLPTLTLEALNEKEQTITQEQNQVQEMKAISRPNQSL